MCLMSYQDRTLCGDAPYRAQSITIDLGFETLEAGGLFLLLHFLQLLSYGSNFMNYQLSSDQKVSSISV